MQKTKEQLEERRKELWATTGQRQFTKNFIEAELLQMNQELLDINNNLAKIRDEPKAPIITPVPPIEDVVTPTVQ